MSDEHRVTRIACAAIRMEYGQVYCGPNHAWILREHYAKRGEQGFVNYRGEFLSREQALLFAEQHNQINVKHSPKDQLMSEDLW